MDNSGTAPEVTNPDEQSDEVIDTKPEESKQTLQYPSMIYRPGGSLRLEYLCPFTITMTGSWDGTCKLSNDEDPSVSTKERSLKEAEHLHDRNPLQIKSLEFSKVIQKETVAQYSKEAKDNWETMAHKGEGESNACTSPSHHPNITPDLRLSDLMGELSEAHKVELHKRGLQEGDYAKLGLRWCRAYHVDSGSSTHRCDRLQLDFTPDD